MDPSMLPEPDSAHVSYLRDLAVLRLPTGHDRLAVACDAVGGLGSKPADTFLTEPECVGYFAARVVLAELLSIKAEPVLVICTLTVELHPTGAKLLEGVRQQLRELGLIDRVGIINSVETNFPTKQTGMGVAMLGVLPVAALTDSAISEGDSIYRLGAPRTGLQIGDPDILPLHTIRALTSADHVREVVPLGSRGVASELAQLRARGVSVERDTGVSEDELVRSGGPANAALVIIDSSFARQKLNSICTGQQLLLIGTVTGVDKTIHQRLQSES